MAFRWFPTWTVAELLAELDKALAERAAGRIVVSAGAGDTSVTELIQTGVDDRINKIWHDLFILDPTTYPMADGVLEDRTKVAFS